MNARKRADKAEANLKKEEIQDKKKTEKTE